MKSGKVNGNVLCALCAGVIVSVIAGIVTCIKAIFAADIIG